MATKKPLKMRRTDRRNASLPKNSLNVLSNLLPPSWIVLIPSMGKSVWNPLFVATNARNSKNTCTSPLCRQQIIGANIFNFTMDSKNYYFILYLSFNFCFLFSALRSTYHLFFGIIDVHKWVRNPTNNPISIVKQKWVRYEQHQQQQQH